MRAAAKKAAYPGAADLPPGDWSGDDTRALADGSIVRTRCWFRGTYGSYPRAFRRYTLDISVSGLVLRTPWYELRRRVPQIAEPVSETFKRPHDPALDRGLRYQGRFAEGKRFAFVADDVIVCRTPRGTLELAVPRIDAHLLSEYVHLARASRPT